MVTIRHLSPINCNCKFSFFYLVCFVCLVRCYNERYWAKNTQECDWTLVLGCLYCAGVAVLEQYLMNSLRLGQEMLPVHWHTDIWVTSCSSCFPFNLKHVCCCPHSAQGDSYFISQKAWRFQTLFCESLIRKSNYKVIPYASPELFPWGHQPSPLLIQSRCWRPAFSSSVLLRYHTRAETSQRYTKMLLGMFESDMSNF